MKINYAFSPDCFFPAWCRWPDNEPLVEGNEAEYVIHSNTCEWFVPGTVSPEDFD